MAKLKRDYIEWVLQLDSHRAKEEFEKLQAEGRRLTGEIAKTTEALNKLEEEGKKDSQEWQDLINKQVGYRKALEDNAKQMELMKKQLDMSAWSVGQLEKKLRILKKSLKDTSPTAEPDEYKRLTDEIARVEEQLKKTTSATRAFGKAWNATDKLKALITGFFTAISKTIIDSTLAAFKNLINTIQDFSAANSRLAAIIGTSKEGIAQLTEQAKELGRTTTATASQVTELQTELAKLGFGQESIVAMTPSVLKFSKAVGTDLGSAAAFAGATLRIFGRDASETEDVLATLAISTSRSALDFSKLQASMATIGPVAASFGLSLEDTTAMLGTLANAGFDASSAATATRNILLNLCDANGELAQALGGPVKNLDDLAAGLNKLQSEGIDLAKALELTDKRSVAAFSNFLAQSDSMLTLRDSITDVSGEFDQMSKTMADNAKGAQAGFMSAIEGLILRFGDMDSILKALYNTGTVIVQFIGNALEVFTPFVNMIKWLGAAIAALVSGIGSLLSPLAKWLKQSGVLNVTLKILAGIVSTLVSAWAAYKTALIAAAAWSKIMTLNIKSHVTSLWLQVKATFAAKTAQDQLNTSMKANPIGAIISLIVGLIAVISTFIKTTNSAKKELSYLNETQNEHNSLIGDAIIKYENEKKKLEELHKTANNETLSKERRLKAIEALNKIVPEYNGSLDEEGRKLKANTKAIDEYLKKLDEKLIKEANTTHLSKLVDANEAKKRELYKIYKTNLDTAKALEAKCLETINKGNIVAEHIREQAEGVLAFLDMTFSEWYEQQNTQEAKALADFQTYLEETGQSLEETVENGKDKMDELNDAAHDLVDRLKEIDRELKQLRKRNPQSNEELHAIQARIKALEEEKKQILGNAKAMHEVGTYREDSLDKVSAPIQEKHQQKLLDINSQKGAISETELAIKRNQELIRYCTELSEALDVLRSETNETHTQTLDKIAQEQNKLAADIQNAQQQINAAYTRQMKEEHEKRLHLINVDFETTQKVINQSIAEGKTTREASEIYMLGRERSFHEEQLAELQRYHEEVMKSDSLGNAEKLALLQDIEGKIRKAQTQVYTDTGVWVEKMRELSTNAASPEGLKSHYDLLIINEKKKYEEMISLAESYEEDTVALEAEKNRRIEALNYELQEKLYELQKITGVSWADEFDHELSLLKHQHDQGLIEERRYQTAKLKMQITHAKKYFDYYAGTAGSMFSALQDAEIAQSEAKYEVLISQAKANGEDTTALEEEKEAKTLEIQKKYADVQFAVKISEIIANTAVAIMQAFAQLGPIGGAIAAAMLTVTGGAQVALAKAERDRVKGLKAGSSSTSSSAEKSTANYTRVMTGYADGGYTGDGGRYEVAGFVHRGEYVVPKPIMGDRRVVDAVGVIEGIRRNRIGAGGNSSAGYANGGYTDSDSATAAISAELVKAISDLRAATEATRNRRNYVLLQDIDRARDVLDLGQNVFRSNLKK